MPEVTLSGKLEAFFETGTEGVLWSFIPNGREGYENLHVLQNGDRLTVFADAACAITKWQGNVDLEYERNWQNFPLNPQYGQQAVEGCWVHGLERTLPPETWARMFFDAAPAQLTFVAEEKVSTFSGRLDKFIVPNMQAPIWVLKTDVNSLYLGNADSLTVYNDEHRNQVSWSGVVELTDIDIRTRIIYPSKGETVGPEDIRSHIFPTNIPSELWEQFISEKRPADLVRRFWQQSPS